MKAVARGADVAAPLRLQFADTIMQEANAIHPPLRPDNYLRSESDIETSLIFAACKVKLCDTIANLHDLFVGAFSTSLVKSALPLAEPSTHLIIPDE